jgi:hypothetical protein
MRLCERFLDKLISSERPLPHTKKEFVIRIPLR